MVLRRPTGKKWVPTVGGGNKKAPRATALEGLKQLAGWQVHPRRTYVLPYPCLGRAVVLFDVPGTQVLFDAVFSPPASTAGQSESGLEWVPLQDLPLLPTVRQEDELLMHATARIAFDGGTSRRVSRIEIHAALHHASRLRRKPCSA